MPRRRFYVGATGDGTIYRGTLGDHTVHTFIAGVPGSRSAVGLKIFRHKLYVAGGMTGKLFVYDLKHPAADPITLDTGAGGFLNDLVVTGKGNVYVTDSFRPTLWHVAAKQVKPLGVIDPISVSPEIPYTAGAFNLNGIVAFRGGREHLTFLRLNSGRSRARIVDLVSDPTLRGPSTVAVARQRYLVVNADFSTSTQPFTVSGLSRDRD
jgi:Cu-Zn family superoxide dismutase